MVVSDNSRASNDLPPLIRKKQLPLPVRNAGLPRWVAGTRLAAELALDCSRDADLGEAAISALRRLLRLDSDYEFPKSRRFDDPEWLLDLIRSAEATIGHRPM